jgi:hypothetical protein
MDIELRLREILPLRDPGAAFTDGVMARVAEAPAVSADAGVVQLSEARARRRSRRILIGTVVVIAAAAAMPVYFLGGGRDAPLISKGPAVIPVASVTTAPDAPSQSLVSTEPAGAAASNPPNCVDPDVLNGLLLRMIGQTLRISASPPPELAGFKAPRQLVWMGSSERGKDKDPMSTLSAVYRTSLAPDAARSATGAALGALGWKPQANHNPMSGNVFIAENFPAADAYCREGKQISLAARALEGVTYVVLAVPRKHAGASAACDQPPPPGAAAQSALDAYLPKLEMPQDPATGAPVPVQSMAGGAGSNTQRRMNVTFVLRDSADNVARHFARQMAQQGWTADVDWSGRDTAGSSWTRHADGDVLQATVVVSAFADGQFTTVFHVVRTK